MKHEHLGHRRDDESFWRSRAGVAAIVFLAAIGLLLGFEHRAHLFTGYGPIVLLLLLCVGMHLFMHGGHSAHDGGSHDDQTTRRDD